MTVRLDRVQQGLFEAFAGVVAAGGIVWTSGQPPKSELGDNILSLKMTAGPSPHIRKHARGTILLPATSVVVRVTAATAGVRNIIRLNGFDFFRDTVALDTLTTIRDGLLAKITDSDTGEPSSIVTAVTAGADGILLTGAFLGGLRRLQLLGELTNDPPVFSGDAVLETEGTSTGLVTVQAFSKGKEPSNGAQAIIDRALDKLQSVGVVTELERFGVGLWGISGTTDLTAITAGNWETRAAFDVTIAAKSTSIEAVGQIETATAIIAVGSETITATATTP